MEMEWFEIGGMMIGLVVGLMALGIPVAFAFLLSNIVGALFPNPARAKIAERMPRKTL